MYPVLFDIGNITVYSYGFMIAVGAISGVAYMAYQGKREAGLTFDQANTLFLLIFIAALAGGKVFLFFEDVSYYSQHPASIFKGRGFVFYGSFLFAIPAMLYFFRKHRLHTYAMLDVMAITTCLVHGFGRIGCFLAGCCYGEPTGSLLGVTFTHEACFAKPLGTPLHPTQLYEAVYIFLVMGVLLVIRSRRIFYGQLFLLYLLAYAAGRFVIEFFRGDPGRGYVIDNYISHSQFIAVLIFAIVLVVYLRKRTRGEFIPVKPRS
jgi:phosphatidylglycerol---prolipoprotein diacylglyceryl transferase